MAEKVAFLGLGTMGASMSLNLFRKGYDVTVWNRSPGRAKALIAEGAKSAPTPKDAASGKRIVFTCVTNAGALNEILFGVDGVTSASSLPVAVIDHSTIAPQEARQIAGALSEKGVRFLDAPVTGGDVGAQKATLTIMVGGDEALLAEARPMLEAMGKKIILMGDIGSGQLAKCANQIAGAGAVAAMSEGLAFAERHGLPLESTLEILRGGAAGSWALDNYGPRVLKRDFSPGFLAEHMLKDLKITLAEADAVGEQLPLTDLLAKLYQELCQLVPAGTTGNHGLSLLYAKKKLGDF